TDLSRDTGLGARSRRACPEPVEGTSTMLSFSVLFEVFQRRGNSSIESGCRNEVFFISLGGPKAHLTLGMTDRRGLLTGRGLLPRDRALVCRRVTDVSQFIPHSSPYRVAMGSTTSIRSSSYQPRRVRN